MTGTCRHRWLKVTLLAVVMMVQVAVLQLKAIKVTNEEPVKIGPDTLSHSFAL